MYEQHSISGTKYALLMGKEQAGLAKINFLSSKS